MTALTVFVCFRVNRVEQGGAVMKVGSRGVGYAHWKKWIDTHGPGFTDLLVR